LTLDEGEPGQLTLPLAKGAEMSDHCKTALDDRCRDADGEIRRKRGDTLVGTLRGDYGPNFASGARSDMRLDTLLNRTGSASLSDYLKNHKK
jgi:hypothetical protein